MHTVAKLLGIMLVAPYILDGKTLILSLPDILADCEIGYLLHCECRQAPVLSSQVTISAAWQSRVQHYVM